MQVSINAKEFKRLVNDRVITTADGDEITLGEDVNWTQMFTIFSTGFADAHKCTIKKVERGY